MSDFLIGLDLDGVCYNFDKIQRYMLRRRYIDTGRIIPPALTHLSRSWDDIENAIDAADWNWLWTEGVEQGLFRYGSVVCGFPDGIKALSRLGDIVVVTHRPKAAFNDTVSWIEFMFGKTSIPVPALEHLSDGRPKSRITPQPDVYIDDALHVAQDVLDNTRADIILYDQPWNQAATFERRLWRAHTWRDVVEYVDCVKKGDCR